MSPPSPHRLFFLRLGSITGTVGAIGTAGVVLDVAMDVGAVAAAAGGVAAAVSTAATSHLLLLGRFLTLVANAAGAVVGPLARSPSILSVVAGTLGTVDPAPRRGRATVGVGSKAWGVWSAEMVVVESAGRGAQLVSNGGVGVASAADMSAAVVIAFDVI